MRSTVLIATAVAASMAAAPLPAVAQQQNGLVNVNLGDVEVRNVLTNILNNNQISIPANVQVPIGIAANICGTTVAALTKQVRSGDNTCDATTANAALARIVSKNARKAD